MAILLSLGLSARYDRVDRSSSCVVSVAQSQIGVRETWGPNNGPEIRQYLLSVGVNTPAYWCAAFVHWVFDQCGVETSITAWSPTAAASNVIYSRGGRNNQVPRSGDVGTLYYSKLGRVGHCFIIEGWGDKVVTIEGNGSVEGSRNGDRVVRKIRPRKSIYKVSRWVEF